MVFFALDYLDSERTHRLGFSEFLFDRGHPTIFGNEFPRCRFCGSEIGPLPWLPPHHVVLSKGTPGDLCTNGSALIFSRRFRDRWNEGGLSGLKLFEQPVHVRYNRKTSSGIGQMPEYFVGQPNYVLTRLNETESGLVAHERDGCDQCGTASRERVARLCVDERTWSGDDLFSPSGLYGEILVTERFVEFVRKNSFTNFHFTHQDDYREPRFGPLK